MAGRDMIWMEDLPFKIELVSQETLQPQEEDFSLNSAEKEHILKALNYTKWNKTRAAGLLKISRPTLDKKVKEYNLEAGSR